MAQSNILKCCRKCGSYNISEFHIRNVNGHAFYFYECNDCGNTTKELRMDKRLALLLWNKENCKCLHKK